MSRLNSEAIAKMALRHGVKRREIRVRQTQRIEEEMANGGGSSATFQLLPLPKAGTWIHRG